jgi:hypothetical protein
VDATDVVISMVLVGVTYLLLLVTWLYVLDHKIKAGPEAPAELAAAAARRKQGWVDTAAEFTDPGGRSLTDAHDDRPESDRRR